MSRVIFHIDINAFFASAHMTQDPSLKGLPLAVSTNNRGSVVTTASYEARAFGVNSAQPVVQALKLCPELKVIPVDFDLYHELSGDFIKLIQEYTPLVEQASIDECYVDVSEVIKTYPKPMDLAFEIQSRIEKELGLPTSIGVGPNKFLAKMGSDFKKPMGISVMRIRELSDTIWPLPVHEMHGVGRKTLPKLLELGINTIGDLAKQDPLNMRHVLGLQAQIVIDRANGLDFSEIVVDSDMKSMGQSSTFRDGIADYDEIQNKIKQFTKTLIAKLIANGAVTKTVQLGIRLDDMKGSVRSFTFDQYTHDFALITERLLGLYDEFDGEGRVYFLSVTFNNMMDSTEVVDQLTIFNQDENPTTQEIIRKLNDVLDGKIFKRASEILKDKS